MIEASPREHLVTLVSTRTIDRFPAVGSRPAYEQPGGPANYIGAAFHRLGCPCRLITGETALVDVLLDSEGEQYVIPALPLIPLPDRLDGDATVLSPIMREIDPDRIPPVDGLLVVDLQGFVREPLRPSGAAGPEVELAGLLRRASVVKGGEEELRRLTRSSLAAVHDTTLIITRGARGAIIRRGDREDVIPAQRVPVDHAVGAGDTFLAAFVWSLVRDGDPVQAGHEAARYAERILRERIREELEARSSGADP
jgi:hypothetical protein